ncbi:hypothetical protein C8R43DRAFT_1146724 [Mycena crocata]|nr:hypothetical protein C8R43DRAFT_1146724 [Mycena crocata]
MPRHGAHGHRRAYHIKHITFNHISQGMPAAHLSSSRGIAQRGGTSGLIILAWSKCLALGRKVDGADCESGAEDKQLMLSARISREQLSASNALGASRSPRESRPNGVRRSSSPSSCCNCGGRSMGEARLPRGKSMEESVRSSPSETGDCAGQRRSTGNGRGGTKCSSQFQRAEMGSKFQNRLQAGTGTARYAATEGSNEDGRNGWGATWASGRREQETKESSSETSCLWGPATGTHQMSVCTSLVSRFNRQIDGKSTSPVIPVATKI